MSKLQECKTLSTIKKENPELKDLANDWFSEGEKDEYRQMLKQVQHDSSNVYSERNIME